MITDPVTGQTQTVRQAMTSDDAYRGISPVDNTIQMENLSPIDIGTLDDYDDLNDYNRALDAANTSRTIDRAPDIFDINQTGDPALNPGSKMVQGDDPYGTVTEEDIADNTSLLQKLGLPADFDLKQAAIEAGINLVAGVPITLIGKALGAVLPDGLTATTNLARETGLLSGDTTVTQDKYGINTQTSFDPVKSTQNYTDYNVKQVAKLENVLDDLKTGKYKDDPQAYLDNTKRLRQELEDRKEFVTRSGVGGDIQETGDASIAEQIAEADRLGISGDIGVEGEDTDRFGGGADRDFAPTGVNPFADIDTGVGDFDTTPTEIDTGIKLGPRKLDQDLSTLGDDLSAELFGNQIIDDNPYDEIEGQTAMLQDPNSPFLPMTDAASTMPPDVRRQQQEDFKAQEEAITTLLDSPLANEFVEQFTGVAEDRDVIDRGGGDDISTGGLDRNRGQQVDRGSSGAGDNEPVSTTTGPPSTGFQPQSTYDAELEDDRDVGGGGNDGGGGGGGGGGKSIVCTAMYQTTGLEDWSKAMKIWYIYQKKYLTIQHQEGYHKLFKPFVKGMHKNKIIRIIGAHVAKHRTQDLKHIMFGSKSSWLGRVYRKILEPICYIVGKYVK